MTNFYDAGDVVRLTANFTDISNNPADPTAVVLRVKQPDTTVTVFNYPGGTIVRDGTGAYHYDLSITESGDHYYRFEASGAVQTAAENLFHVRRSNVLT